MKKIPLTRGKFALVDDEDYEFLNQWKWTAHRNHGTGYFYTMRTKWVGNKKTCISMHQIIMNTFGKKIQVDHIDKNPLNNQRNNLRLATKSQNGANRRKMKNASSRYLGVAWYEPRNKWRSQIKKDNVVRHIGYYFDEKEAALAYNVKATQLHGDFASINKI